MNKNKICHRCSVTKNTEEFSTNDSVCKKCRAEYMRAKRHFTPDGWIEYHKEWKMDLLLNKGVTHRLFDIRERMFSDGNLIQGTSKDRVRWVKRTISSHKRKYDCSELDYDFLANLALKTMVCKICGTPLTFSQKFSRFTSASLDRMDNSKKITNDSIQIICYRCNTTKKDRTMEEFIDYCWEISKKYK